MSWDPKLNRWKQMYMISENNIGGIILYFQCCTRNILDRFLLPINDSSKNNYFISSTEAIIIQEFEMKV